MPSTKLILSAALASFSLASFISCEGSPHAADEKYYLVATNIKLPYWQSALTGLNRAASEMKVKAELAGPDTYDPQAEVKEFQRVAALKPAGILVSPGDPNLMGPAIDAAVAQGIPVITVDSDAPASKRLFFVGTDNYKAGTVGGQLTAKLLGDKGNIAVFTIKGQANLDQRLHGYQDVFDTHPQMKVAQVIDIKGDPTAAFDATKQIVDTKAKIDALVCLEAIACPEAAEVVSRAGLSGKITIVAMDTDQRTTDWVQKGVISATIAQKPFTMAFYGVKLVDDLHHHPPTPLTANWAQDSFSHIPTFVDTGASLVDKSNIAAFTKPAQ
jgi:ribose transport system substrate-binding protein